ncbi:TPA: SprT family protein [Streptococcus pneumoniae]|nr:SprT family protein [Streptococcus pneumoniae]
MKLTDYVKQVSLEDFGRPFIHHVQWNRRLRSTGGRFFPKDGHLDFNPIVRHELCHYHLYFQGKGYQHKDRDFKELLKAVDGLRFVPSLPNSNSKPIKLYRCQSCQQTYQRKRRIDTRRYRCGLCRGKLLLINQPED